MVRSRKLIFCSTSFSKVNFNFGVYTIQPHVQSRLCVASESLGILLSLSLAAASELEPRRKRLCGLSRCQGLPPHATLLSAFVNCVLVTDLSVGFPSCFLFS